MPVAVAVAAVNIGMLLAVLSLLVDIWTPPSVDKRYMGRLSGVNGTGDRCGTSCAVYQGNLEGICCQVVETDAGSVARCRRGGRAAGQRDGEGFIRDYEGSYEGEMIVGGRGKRSEHNVTNLETVGSDNSLTEKQYKSLDESSSASDNSTAGSGLEATACGRYGPCIVALGLGDKTSQNGS